MVAFSANDPITATLKDSTTVSGVGYLLTMDSTNNKLDLTANDEIAIGVSIMVASQASQTYTTGLLVYAQASGLAGTTSSSRKLIGVYVGTGEVTSSSAGDLIPVNVTQAATS